MVKSMTGFGKITIENGNRKVVIEIKSLNSKTLDLNLKMPNLYKEKEMEIRNIVKEQLDRGKVEMCIYFDNTESDKDVTINKPVVTQYFNQLLDIANELGIEADKNKILQTVMRFPANQIGRVGRYRMGGFGSWNKKSFGRNQQIQNPGRKSFNQRYMSPHRTYSGTVCSGTSI